MSDDELSELSTWIETVYSWLTDSRSNWPDLPALALSSRFVPTFSPAPG
jgi:hypothetical protein